MKEMRIFLPLAALIFTVPSLGQDTITATVSGAAESQPPPAARMVNLNASDGGHRPPTGRVAPTKLTAAATIAGALNDMARPSDVPLTPELARSVCKHTRSRAYAGGSIVRHDAEFAIRLQAMDCQSGQTLAQEQSTAQSKENILDALADAVSTFRSQLGESEESVGTFNTPLSRASSGSFEALRAWNAGIRAQH